MLLQSIFNIFSGIWRILLDLIPFNKMPSFHPLIKIIETIQNTIASRGMSDNSKNRFSTSFNKYFILNCILYTNSMKSIWINSMFTGCFSIRNHFRLFNIRAFTENVDFSFYSLILLVAFLVFVCVFMNWMQNIVMKKCVCRVIIMDLSNDVI